MKKIFCLALILSVSANAQIKKNEPEVQIVTTDDNSLDNVISPVGSLEPEYDPEKIYNVAQLEVPPVYQGGVKNFKAEVEKKIKAYNSNAKSGTRLKAFVSFIIEKDGSISNVKLLRDPGYDFGKGAVATIRNMKKIWSPGLVNGKPIRALVTLPIEIVVP